MAKPRPLPQQHSQFDALPIVRITVGPANEHVAVHVAGRLGPGCTPVVCVPGYNRNMVDYFDLVRLGRTLLPEATPLVLVDAKGRGRSDRHRSDKARCSKATCTVRTPSIGACMD